MTPLYLLELGDGIVYAPLPYLVRHLAVPAGTLRRWAAADRWPRRHVHGRAYYLLASAEASAQRRHRDTPQKRGA